VEGIHESPFSKDWHNKWSLPLTLSEQNGWQRALNWLKLHKKMDNTKWFKYERD